MKTSRSITAPARGAAVRRLLGAMCTVLLALGPALLAQSGGDAAPASVPAYRQANTVAVLTIEGVIDQVTLHSLERRVAEARRDSATAVVLDIDTPGGALNATLDICHLLKTDAPANTVAWINPQAYSAGTIMALACREIVLQENASFGDAAPIAATPIGLVPLPAAERAKAESPILEEVIESARRNHYDERLVQAFVSVGVELWLVEHKTTGERIFVDREEYRRVFGEEPPQQQTVTAPPERAADPRPVVPYVDQFFPSDEDGAEAAGEEAADGEAGDASSSGASARPELTPTRPPLTEADHGQYRLVRQVISNERLLTLKSTEAKFYGLATTTIRDEQELKAYFGAQTLVRYDESWSEVTARFLMSFPVRALLIVIFLISLFIELAAPGIGVFGITAMVALLVLVGAPAMVGLAQWWGIAMVFLGLILIAVELFMLPGVGVAGLLGLLSLLIGMVGAFVTGDLSSTQGRYELWASVTTVITSFFAAGVLIWLISRQLKTLPFLDRVVLRTELGATPASSTGMLETMGATTGQRVLQVGDVGVAHTSLRPNGRASIDDRLVDVQSVDGFIEKGTPVRVVSVGRFVIEVEVANE